MSRSTRAARTPVPVRVAGSIILGSVCALGGFVLLLGTGRGDPRLFEVWPLLAVTTLGLAGAIAAVLYRRTSRPPADPAPTGSLMRRATADAALVMLISGVLGVTVVVAWVAIGGLEVFQGPAHVSRTRGLLITVLLAFLAAGVGAVLTRFRKQRMSTEALIGLGFAAWIGELLVLLVLGRLLADELGRGVGVVVTTWVVATAGIVQPVAFVVGGLVGREVRRDRVGRPAITVEPSPGSRFRNGFVVHEYTDVPDFPLVEDFSVGARWTGVLGAHMQWTSASLGPLTWFPWWDHLELDDTKMDPDRPPVGTWEDPFYDADQGWEFNAWDDGVHVFVATGGDPGQIDGAYRVPRQVFLTAWRDGIATIRAMRPPDTDGRS